MVRLGLGVAVVWNHHHYAVLPFLAGQVSVVAAFSPLSVDLVHYCYIETVAAVVEVVAHYHVRHESVLDEENQHRDNYCGRYNCVQFDEISDAALLSNPSYFAVDNST